MVCESRSPSIWSKLGPKKRKGGGQPQGQKGVLCCPVLSGVTNYIVVALSFLSLTFFREKEELQGRKVQAGRKNVVTGWNLKVISWSEEGYTVCNHTVTNGTIER